MDQLADTTCKVVAIETLLKLVAWAGKCARIEYSSCAAAAGGSDGRCCLSEVVVFVDTNTLIGSLDLNSI